MFTGLVQATGRIEQAPSGVRLRWSADPSLAGVTPWMPQNLALGDSVAVDGVCLTVAECLVDGFRADVSPETLGRSTLAAKAAAGDWVNLEPALRLADRLGGHLVSGHVDGLGQVRAIRPEANAWRLELQWQDPAYGRYICEKASVAVDGISLTVAGCEPGGSCFWIAVIPHTWGTTTLQQLRPGSWVNLEADLLAKYTERLLNAGAASGSGPNQLDSHWMAEHGWTA
ncbi:riboflavin synthase [Cyanobium sp. HWJ4-Hawea]|uniref:riboflavin synthase n=1 Tax=Cyanobium sp. HWJ4-Hawea TaxID=2823713 RepID=UPI0020CB6F83|nr:riboflavin synthase [Cyanobium sp. HWJ4-Hawea]MCP9807841.1 riboflavin synthase [Cyanobium sp. HWJ4-Hawea]